MKEQLNKLWAKGIRPVMTAEELMEMTRGHGDPDDPGRSEPDEPTAENVGFRPR